MGVTDVMDVVAVEIHVAPTVAVLEPNAFGPTDGRQTGCGDRLVQERLRVSTDQILTRGTDELFRPASAARRRVDVALAVGADYSWCTLRHPWRIHAGGH